MYVQRCRDVCLLCDEVRSKHHCDHNPQPVDISGDDDNGAFLRPNDRSGLTQISPNISPSKCWRACVRLDSVGFAFSHNSNLNIWFPRPSPLARCWQDEAMSNMMSKHLAKHLATNAANDDNDGTPSTTTKSDRKWQKAPKWSLCRIATFLAASRAAFPECCYLARHRIPQHITPLHCEWLVAEWFFLEKLI